MRKMKVMDDPMKRKLTVQPRVAERRVVPDVVRQRTKTWRLASAELPRGSGSWSTIEPNHHGADMKFGGYPERAGEVSNVVQSDFQRGLDQFGFQMKHCAISLIPFLF
jgi:hypothetical protein